MPTPKKTTPTPTGPTKSAASTPPLENMPTPPAKPPKSERLFVAWKGGIIKTTLPGETEPDESRTRLNLEDVRVFGRKDQCTEFAVDQEPAWKWVETAKGESVHDAIMAKAGY